MVSLLEFAKKAGIRMELNYFNEGKKCSRLRYLKELQSNWKEVDSRVTFESISNDLNTLMEGLAGNSAVEKTSSSINQIILTKRTEITELFHI